MRAATIFAAGVLCLTAMSPSIIAQPVRRVHFGRDMATNGYDPADTASYIGNYVDFPLAGLEIAGTDGDDDAYSSHVWTPGQSLVYLLDLPDSTFRAYNVTLGWAETYAVNCVQGGRVFSVSVQDEKESDIDVFERAGCSTAYRYTFSNVNAAGTIKITLERGHVENPFLSNVEVTLAGTDPVPTLPPEGEMRKINFGLETETDGYEPADTNNIDGTFVYFPGEGNAIGGTGADTAFDSHVWTFGISMGYLLDLSPGESYDVTLGFAESYSPNCINGARVFSVSVGSKRIDDIDVHAAVGCRRAYRLPFRNVIADPSTGVIAVSLIRGPAENPFLSLIEISPSEAVLPPVPNDTLKINFGRTRATNSYRPAILDNIIGDFFYYGGEGLSIAGTSEDLAFESHLWIVDAAIDYILELNAGQLYDVTLGFAESHIPNCEDGARIFSVSVGDQEMADLDVHKKAGCRRAYRVPFQNVAADPETGRIIVSLRKGPAGDPFLALIEVKPAGDASPLPTPTPRITPRPSPQPEPTSQPSQYEIATAPPTLEPLVKLSFGGSVPPEGFALPVPENIIGSYVTYGGAGTKIISADNDQAYASHVWSSNDFGYNVDGLDPTETYDVILGFAESFTVACNFGVRVFSATVGMTTTKNNIDVFSSAGCRRKYDLVFENIEPDFDGTINVMLNKGPAGNPFLAAIKVAPRTKGPPPLIPTWFTVDSGTTLPTQRVEGCFVNVNGLGYLVGGRGTKPVDVYDPSTQTWASKTGLFVELHHMQCVAVGSEVWIVSAWTGEFPFEQAVESIYIYDTVSDSWSTRPGLPPERRRGAAAAVYHEGDIYVSHGNQGGHGGHAKTLNYLDKYNIANATWTALPSAPNARDHTGGAIVDGRLCVAAGRNSGVDKFFNAVVRETDCFDFVTQTWTVEASIPQGRAGSAYGQTCDGKLMVAGGEGFGIAWPYVDVFDGSSWTSYPELVVGRQGTGLAFSCECNQVHIAAGSGAQGDLPLPSTETLFFSGQNEACIRDDSGFDKQQSKGDSDEATTDLQQ